jgi:hypothetical protein
VGLLASAEMMEGNIYRIRIAASDQRVEISLDNSALRCTTVVIQKSSNMFEERYSLLQTTMMSQKKGVIWVSESSCAANNANPGTTVIY